MGQKLHGTKSTGTPTATSHLQPQCLGIPTMASSCPHPKPSQRVRALATLLSSGSGPPRSTEPHAIGADPSLPSATPTPPHTHSALVTWTLFLKRARHASISGPLPAPCPAP